MADEGKANRTARRIAPAAIACLVVAGGCFAFAATTAGQVSFDPSSYLAGSSYGQDSGQLDASYDLSSTEADSQANKQDDESANASDTVQTATEEADGESQTPLSFDEASPNTVYQVDTEGNAQTTIVLPGTNDDTTNDSTGAGTATGPVIDTGDETGGGQTPSTTPDSNSSPDPTPAQPTYTKQTAPDYITNGTYSDLDDTVTYQKDEDGNEVLSLAVSGSFPRAFYVNESIDNESLYSGITVTATKRNSSGKTFTQTIAYGSYSVNASTTYSGDYSAVFDYCGTTASLPYSVQTTTVTILGARQTGSGYDTTALIYDDDSNINHSSSPYPLVTGSPIDNSTGSSSLDLTAYFKQYLAWYAGGMPTISSSYDYTNQQPRITDKNGGSDITDDYLTVMAYGFTSNFDSVNGTSGPYSLNTSVSSSSYNTTTYLALGSVPTGALLKLKVVDNVGEQVLVGCTSAENGTFTVPTGTTKIALDECSDTATVTNQITKLIIPSSVSSIDAQSLNTYATSLQRFEVSSDNATFSSQDGLLMDKAGTTVLAVPAGASSITIPAGTTLSADALSGRTSDLTITLTEKTPSDSLLESIKAAAAAANTNATITIEVPDSTYDAVFKKYHAAWGPTLPSNVKLSVAGNDEVASCYKLRDDGSIVRTSDESILSAVPWGKTSYSATGIKEVESAALCTAPNLNSLSFDSLLAQIDACAFENNTTTYVTLESTTPPSIGSKILGESADNIFISVPEGSLSDYLSNWTTRLDGEYGEGATEQVLGAQSGIVNADNGGIYKTKSDGFYELIDVSTTASGTFIVDSNTTSIAANAFDGCSGITSIVVQNGVTEIKSSAFSGCESLEIITLPASLTAMASDALEGCTSLKAIGCNAAAAPSNSLELSASSVSIFVPEGSTDGYSSWSTAGTVSEAGTTYVLDSKVLYARDSSDSNIGILAADSTIDGTVAVSYTITSISDYAFANCTALEGADFTGATGLVSIGKGAFSGCSKIGTLNFQLCTALTSLGESAFANCTELTQIRFDNGKLTEIPNDCCNGCNKLEYAYLSKTSSADNPIYITIGDRAFSGCKELTNTSLFNASIYITTIGEEAFYDCAALKIHNYDGTCLIPSTLTSIGASAFKNCSQVGVYRSTSTTAYITALPDGLTELGESAFANTAVRTVTIGSNLTSIGKYAFSGCTALSKVTLETSGAGTSGLQIIGVEAFEGCSSLASIDLNSATNLLALGNRAFQGCSALEYVILPKSLGASGSIGDNCFNECSSLTKVYSTADEAPYIGSTIFGSSVDTDALTVYVSDSARSDYVNAWTAQLDDDYGDGSTEKLLSGTESGTIILDALGGTVEYRINSDGGYTLVKATGLTGSYVVMEGTTAIASDAFTGCVDTLTGISFANCETLTFGDRCFKDCTALKTVTFNCNVTEMGESVFENCDSLTTVTLAKGYTIDRLGTRCFADCDKLATMTALNGTIKVFGTECFAECDKLSAITSAGVKNGLISIENGAFKNCTSWKGLASSANNTYKSLVSIGDEAFAGCTAITADYIPSGVTALSDSLYEGCTNLVSVMYYGNVTSIGNNCFKGCTKLAGAFTYYASGYSFLTSIGDSAFEGCTAFGTQAKVGSYYYLFSLSNFTALESVGSRAFYGCTSLTSAAFASSSLSSIGSEAFYGCTGLTSASFTASLGSIGTDAFTGCSSLTSMTFAGSTAPRIDSFTLPSSMGTGSIICSAYSESPDDAATNESIYNSYLAALTSAIGSENAATVLAKPSTMTSGSSEDGASEDDTTGANIASMASVEEEATVSESESNHNSESAEQEDSAGNGAEETVSSSATDTEGGTGGADPSEQDSSDQAASSDESTADAADDEAESKDTPADTGDGTSTDQPS